MASPLAAALAVVAQTVDGLTDTLRAIRVTQVQHGLVLARLTERINSMATQADIDALVAQLDTIGGSLTAALAGIQGDLDTLKAANPALDLTSLQDKVTALTALSEQATAIDAETPGA